MPTYPFGPGTSSRARLTVHTRAEGLLARLAHDLELASEELRGTATIDGPVWSGQATIPVASLRVVGALRGDRVDPGTLSAGDRVDIERRVRETVFAGVPTITATATGTGDRGEVVVTVGWPGRPASARVPATVAIADDAIRGRCALSLAGLRIAEVKGPLGAFRVRDTVEIAWEIARG